MLNGFMLLFELNCRLMMEFCVESVEDFPSAFAVGFDFEDYEVSIGNSLRMN